MASLDRALQLGFFFLHREFFCPCLAFLFSPALPLSPWPAEFINSSSLPGFPHPGADAALRLRKWKVVKRSRVASIQRLLAKTLTSDRLTKLRGHFDLFKGNLNPPTKVN